jgi:hypothetical protein
MALPEKLTFGAWARSRVFENAARQGPRLAGKVVLTLSDSNTGQQASGDGPFILAGAADVMGIKAAAVKHMAPAPFARDAETTKLVHVDLREPDLPWRYTPRANAAQIAPWIVLLVGTAEEIVVEGGLVTHVDPRVLETHDLSRSHLWAHTQWDGHTKVGRIVSPRGLERPAAGAKPLGLVPNHEYVAVLVPAFNDAGEPMWSGSPPEQHFGTRAVLPAFHSWRFWTADAGDFETLAAALKIPHAGDVGKASLRYHRVVPDVGLDVDATLEVRGAITSLQPEVVPDPGLLAAVKADLDALNDEIPDTLGLPQYGRPWVPEPDAVPDGWANQVTDDPRFRGTTGIGVWMGVEAQEALMDAAVAQAGALREAGQRVGHLAFGLLAAGRLWDRRIPVDANERLRLFGPLMARMVAADGGIVMDRVAARGPLPPAIFSSAAQRLLRDRSGATRHVEGANGGLAYPQALDAANRPEPQPDRVPKGLPHVDAVVSQFGLPTLEEQFGLDERSLDEAMDKLDDLVRHYARRYARARDDLLRAGRPDELPALAQELGEPFFSDLLGTLQALLGDRGLPCEAGGIAQELGAELGTELFLYLRIVLADEGAQALLHDALRRAIRRCMVRRACEEILGHQGEGPSCSDILDALPSEPRPEGSAIDLGGLSGVIVGALDPRRPDAPARVRVCSRLVGIDCTRLIPPEFPIGLDFPTWSVLNQYDREWLLPGVGSLPKDSITALRTNPTFVDAFMLGINTQFMSEMRWRDLAVARTCTPLRMFWGQVDYATHRREPDITPIAEWAATLGDALGAPGHQTSVPPGARLVITFRTDLFRRYPSTLVYLVRPAVGDDVDALLAAPPELDKPDGEDPDAWRARRRHFGPIFAGTLTPELTFFMFDVVPSTLDEYWLVLDEPPAELRFRNDQPTPETDSAALASATLDQPTRVAISGEELEAQGLHP